jgi:hypothetical protein
MRVPLCGIGRQFHQAGCRVNREIPIRSGRHAVNLQPASALWFVCIHPCLLIDARPFPFAETLRFALRESRRLRRTQSLRYLAAACLFSARKSADRLLASKIKASRRNSVGGVNPEFRGEFDFGADGIGNEAIGLDAFNDLLRGLKVCL